MPQHKSGKGGTKKHGRNADKCKAYKLMGRREKNKRIKLRKHLAVHASDTCAQTAIQKIGQ